MSYEKDKLTEIEDAYNEAYSLWSDWISEAEEDTRVTAGDQWDETSLKILGDENRPALVINQIKKGHDLISGKQRQNPTDIVAFPIEGGDEESAEIYTMVIKWIMTNGFGGHYRSLAFEDTLRSGLGWMAPQMNYDEDPLNGRIEIESISPFSILMDGYTTSPELKDCDYIVRYKWLIKDKAKAIYSKYAKDIDKLTTKEPSKFAYNSYRVTDKNIKIYATEKWSRVYEEKKILYDVATGGTEIWEGGQEKLMKTMEMFPDYFATKILIEKRIPRIKLLTSINDSLLVYDGETPDGLSKTKYPFIPIFGFYNPNFPDTSWLWKLYGYTRILKDSQFELNKTRSVFMDSIFTQLLGGKAYELGALNFDEAKKAGAGRDIVINPGYWQKWQQLNPPQMGSALPTLEQMHKTDMREMGLNPDLLGIGGEGASAASAPGISLQLRQNQNLVSLQGLFDNLSIANKTLGKYLIDLINMWTPDKIERIIGRPLPPDWDTKKQSAVYDIIIDEKTGSTTFKESQFFRLQGMLQHGLKPPDRVMLESADLDTKSKKMWLEDLDAQQQSQSQIQELQMQLEQAKMQIELQKQQIEVQGILQSKIIEIKGDMELEKLKQEGDEKITRMEAINKLAIAALNSKNKNA